MFSTEEQRIHDVRRILNVGVQATKGGRVPDFLPQLANAKQSERGRVEGEEQEQTRKWKKLFHYYDEDGGGTLQFHEFRGMVRNALRISESKLADKDLKLLFGRIDSDRSGEIEYHEFAKYVKLGAKESDELPRTLGRALRIALSRMKVRTKTDIQNLFESIDFDADGGISFNQMKKLIRETLLLTQHEFSDYYVKRLMQSIDCDNTGQIELDEFIKFINDHIHLGGITGERSSHRGLADEVSNSLHMTVERTSPSASPRHCSEPAGGSSEKLHGAQHASPYMGGKQQRGYISVRGASRLNRVEGQLCKPGFDIRGEFFKEMQSMEPSTMPALSDEAMCEGGTAATMLQTMLFEMAISLTTFVAGFILFSPRWSPMPTQALQACYRGALWLVRVPYKSRVQRVAGSCRPSAGGHLSADAARLVPASAFPHGGGSGHAGCEAAAAHRCSSAHQGLAAGCGGPSTIR